MNPTIQEMLREAATDLVAQTEAAKARSPLTIALRELEQAKSRIAALERHIASLEFAGMHLAVPDSNHLDRRRRHEAVRKKP